MSGRPIPRPTQGIIAGLMYSENPIAPRFTVEQYTRIQDAAEKEGLSVDQWIERAILASLPVIVTDAAMYPCPH